jgi:MerR HTH family regulatory protein
VTRRQGGRQPGSSLPAAQRTREELAALGVTARQLEYWVERGLVSADGPPVQGHPRSFSDAEKRVLAAMARLVRAGLGAELAARVARQAAERDGPRGPAARVDLGGGVVIEITGA